MHESGTCSQVALSAPNNIPILYLYWVCPPVCALICVSLYVQLLPAMVTAVQLPPVMEIAVQLALVMETTMYSAPVMAVIVQVGECSAITSSDAGYFAGSSNDSDCSTVTSRDCGYSAFMAYNSAYSAVSSNDAVCNVLTSTEGSSTDLSFSDGKNAITVHLVLKITLVNYNEGEFSDEDNSACIYILQNGHTIITL